MCGTRDVDPGSTGFLEPENHRKNLSPADDFMSGNHENLQTDAAPKEMKQAEKRPEKGITTLSRDLNLFQLTMMGVGMMIGAVLGMGHSVGISGPGDLAAGSHGYDP
jgi:amino acid permease